MAQEEERDLNIGYEDIIKIIASYRGASVDAVKNAIDAVATIDLSGDNATHSFSLPTEIYSEAHRKKGENIVEFLERVWRPIIERKLVTLNEMRSIDISVTDAIDNYERQGRDGSRKRLPSHLRFPKIGEVSFQRGKRGCAAGPQSPAVIGLLLDRLAKSAPGP